MSFPATSADALLLLFCIRREQKISLGAQLAVPEDDEVSIVDEVAGPSAPKVIPSTLYFLLSTVSCSNLTNYLIMKHATNIYFIETVP